ncbi:MAG: winged helix-turn-helix transcriptional regulator [Candidatus Helarchaeota archaeon]|nr:winged helix-turn-helix transcriptional regulator [Candidatus Helarchaeota archaeon]
MEELIDPIVLFLKVLADSTRLKIIELLKNTEMTANDIELKLNKSQSTTSQQLSKLIAADILQVRREGVKKFYSIKHPEIFTVLSSVNSYISSRDKEKIEDIASKDIIDTLH